MKDGSGKIGEVENGQIHPGWRDVAAAWSKNELLSLCYVSLLGDTTVSLL